MTKELEEFTSDDGYSTASEPTGKTVGKRKADLNKSVDPTADDVAAAPGNKSSKGAIDGDKTASKDLVSKTVALPEGEEAADEALSEEIIVAEGVAALFEGEELSEEFKTKAGLIFTAAVNEAVALRVEAATAELTEKFDTQLTESVSEAMEEIVESLDGYLDYVVTEWMTENEVAIQTGLQVEMAESLLNGLKGLFYEHNIEIDESTIDVVADLEEELAKVTAEANKTIDESVELRAEIASLKAEKVFAEVTEGLTVTQVERLRVLSEKLNHADADGYASDLQTLKESFFKTGSKKVLTETVADEDEGEILSEDVKTPASPHASVNAYISAINARKK